MSWTHIHKSFFKGTNDCEEFTQTPVNKHAHAVFQKTFSPMNVNFPWIWKPNCSKALAVCRTKFCNEQSLPYLQLLHFCLQNALLSAVFLQSWEIAFTIDRCSIGCKKWDSLVPNMHQSHKELTATIQNKANMFCKLSNIFLWQFKFAFQHTHQSHDTSTIEKWHGQTCAGSIIGLTHGEILRKIRNPCAINFHITVVAGVVVIVLFHSLKRTQSGQKKANENRPKFCISLPLCQNEMSKSGLLVVCWLILVGFCWVWFGWGEKGNQRSKPKKNPLAFQEGGNKHDSWKNNVNFVHVN